MKDKITTKVKKRKKKKEEEECCKKILKMRSTKKKLSWLILRRWSYKKRHSPKWWIMKVNSFMQLQLFFSKLMTKTTINLLTTSSRQCEWMKKIQMWDYYHSTKLWKKSLGEIGLSTKDQWLHHLARNTFNGVSLKLFSRSDQSTSRPLQTSFRVLKLMLQIRMEIIENFKPDSMLMYSMLQLKLKD